MSARGTITSSAVVSRSRSTLAISARSWRSSSGLLAGDRLLVRRLLHQFGDRSRAACAPAGAPSICAQPVEQRRACAVAAAHARFHGLGTPQPVQDARLRQFHAARLAGMVVVVAAQVQRAVHDQMRQVMRRPPAGRARPRAGPRRAPARISGAGAVVGQHIGGLVAAAVARVQPLHRRGRRPARRCPAAPAARGRARRPPTRHAAPAGARPAPPR